MYYYIITFILSIFLFHLYEKNRKNYFLFFLAILPPILLAAFRDYDIGSDVKLYHLDVFRYAIMYQGKFIQMYKDFPEMEILYLALNYIVAKFTSDMTIYYLIAYTLIYTPIFISADLLRKKLSPSLVIFIYFLIAYNDSFSIIRQSFALSYTVLAFTMFLLEKRMLYVIFALIAIGFHKTAYIPLIFPLIYWCIKRYDMRRYKLIYIGLFVIFILIVYNINSIFITLLSGGNLSSKYEIYTEGAAFGGHVTIPSMLAKLSFFIYACYLMIRYKRTISLDFFFVLSLFTVILNLASSLVTPLERLTLYSYTLLCIYLPRVIHIYEPTSYKGTLRLGIPWLLLIFETFIWYYLYIYGDYGSTSDYHFNKLLILF